ncbi:MAG: acyl-CoA/acyl-ACP dehydrogenase [Caldilineaceae bacterium]|nr:acyl-CoA/acyl-ACP dehydrogenase [Caldilineaceae bacterium]
MLYPRTERQQRFIAIARQLAENFKARAALHDHEGSFPHENFDELRRAGLPALVIPEEFGGWGATLLESVLVMETLAVGDGSTALSFTMHVQVMGSAAEARSWPEPLFARLCCESVERGALINAVATEPRLGSPSRGGLPDTTAEPVYTNGVQDAPDAWIINGHKNFASLSPALDYFIIPAAVVDGSGQVARFIVPAGDHIEIDETWDAMGMRATGSHDVYLRNARVTPDLMIGRSDPKTSDPTISMGNAWFTLTVSAVYLGVAQAALEFAVDYAQKRVPTALGKPIAELESIQRRLGEAELALTQARALLYSVANDWDQLPERRRDLSPLLVAAKVTTTNNAILAVDHALRVVGGASMARSLPLERYYRDVRAGLYHPVVDDQAFPILGRVAMQKVAAKQKEELAGLQI